MVGRWVKEGCLTERSICDGHLGRSGKGYTTFIYTCMYVRISKKFCLYFESYNKTK